MNIIIEIATEKDAEALLEYTKQIGGETDNLTFGAEGIGFTVAQEAEYIRRIENSCDEVLFVAKDNGKIIGDASLCRMPRRMNHRGDLGIGVVRKYWNCGVGSRLLSEIIGFAKENSFDIIELQVRSDNASAIHLYEKFGFEKIGTHMSFFKMENENIPFDYMCLKIC